MTNYRYVGDGMGVPGLPHVVTDDEAREQGVGEILATAIANGSYEIVPASQEISVSPSTGPRKARGSAQGDKE